MRNFAIAILLSMIVWSCKPVEEEKKETPVVYSSLKILSDQDTLYMNANGESRQFNLVGTILNTSEKTISNSGFMTEIQYTVRTVDTVYQTVNTTSAQWVSTNSSIASVSNGMVVAHNPGYVTITASIGQTYSNKLNVNVRAVNTAPGLSLNPPLAILIFQNSVVVSGNVQQNARLSISESNSGYQQNNIAYNADGTFSNNVTGLNQGTRFISARAANVNDTTKFTDRVKTVIYYQPNTPEANAIVGNWIGTTLGKNFNFSIEHSVIPTRYDIAGKIDIQFEGVGMVKDIDLIGLINSNGSISISLSKSYQGFSISGKMDGYFHSTGTGSGTYSAQATKSGWPRVSFNDKWTAVKAP